MKNFKLCGKEILGLMYFIGIAPKHSSAPSFQIAILKKEKNKVVFESLQELPLTPGINFHSLCRAEKESLPSFLEKHIRGNFKILFKKWLLPVVKLFYNLHDSQEVKIATGLTGDKVLLRTLHLPLKDKKKILNALPFQLESLLPYPPEAAVICPLLHFAKQMSHVTLFATTQDNLSDALEKLEKLQIVPDVLSCAPNALFRFARANTTEEGKILAFHVEGNSLLCVIFENNKILFSQTLCESKITELEKLSVFLKHKGLIQDDTPWALTGEQALSTVFTQIFSGNKLELLHPEQGPFALPIGYALDAIARDLLSVQFCQKTFAPEHSVKNRQKKGMLYLGACALCTFCCLLLNHTVLGKKEKNLTKRMNHALPSSLELSSIFSDEKTKEALFAWEKMLNKEKSSFPFFANVPKVSDVLAWLSTHSSFAANDGSPVEGIEIQSLHYRLFKYPKIGETNVPYQATLDVNFSAETPRLARHFHEALLQGDQIVNEKKEIKWQVQNHNYFTSFELKKINPS